MDGAEFTVKNEVISGSQTKFYSGESGQESSIVQPQTGKRRRKHKSRKISNKNIQEVNATASGNDLNCNMSGFNDTDTCDDKEAVSLEHIKSVEESGMNNKTEINMLDVFVSQSSGDNNNQDINEQNNLQFFDAYDNIVPLNEHLVQQQITEEQICNCNEFSRGGETLCAWCIVTEESQTCGTENSWQDMEAGEANPSSGNQEFSYGIDGLEEDSYALPLVTFGSDEVLERCTVSTDSPINTVLLEAKNMEDMNDGIICSSNQQEICSSYIDHAAESFEINPKYNDDNTGFYEKECDERAQLSIMEYADGYYDSSGVYCFASVYDNNDEAQCNSLPPTLSASAQEMATDFFDAHSSEHFICIPTQGKCVDPVSTDETYRFPADYEHVSSNLGNIDPQEESDKYERYINTETNSFNVFRESSCQNNEFVNNKHLLQSIDELLLNKEECISTVKTVEVINPQCSENVEDSNAGKVENSKSFNGNSVIYEGYRNEELNDALENIFSTVRTQFLSLNTPSVSCDTTWDSTVNNEPSTQNNTINSKIEPDKEESLSPFDIHSDKCNYSNLIIQNEHDETYTTFQTNTDFADKIDTITLDTSKETIPSISFVPMDEKIPDSSQDLPSTQEDLSITPGIGAPLKNEERTSSFVTTYALNDIEEKIQIELSDSCDVVKESECVNGRTLEMTDSFEMNDIQAESMMETESIQSTKSVAEMIEFYNKLTDVEPEETSKEYNRCVRVREVPASHNLKCENTVFTKSGTCVSVHENDMNHIFLEDTSHAKLTQKIKGIKSETSTFSKQSCSECIPNNSLSNSELYSRDLKYVNGENKMKDKDKVDYINNFENTEELVNSAPYNESLSSSKAAIGETSQHFSNHSITNAEIQNSNILNENKQSSIVGEDFKISIETGNIVAPDTNFNFSDLVSAFNSDGMKYYSKTFMNQNFISVDEDYDIDAIQIKHYNEGSEGMFWERNSDHVYPQDVIRCDNSEDKLNSDAGLSEKLSLRSVERINDENNFTGSYISSPRSVYNSIPNVAFEDILYKYCKNMNKESSSMKNLIKTGVSVKELAKGFDSTVITDAPKEFNYKRNTRIDGQHASPATVECSCKHEQSEDMIQCPKEMPSTSNTYIKTSTNSKIDGLIKEFGEKGSFRRKRRNIDSDRNPESHKCLCMSKSTNAIHTDDKSGMMRAMNVMSCQNSDTPCKAHLYRNTKKHGQNMDCSSNVSVKDIISFFTNYPDPGKAENTADEYTTYDDKAKCCKRNSLSNLCGVCARKEKCSSAEGSCIHDASKKMVATEGQNELFVILTEPENGDVVETRSDNIFLNDRRAASVPFVMCSRPESLIKLNKGEGGNKFLLVLPDVHKLWMKTLPGGKGTISQITEFIQNSAEDIDYGHAVSVKDLVARWNQNSSTNQ